MDRLDFHVPAEDSRRSHFNHIYRLIAPEMIEILGMSLGTFALYIFIFSLIGYIGTVLMIYFSICVGQLFPGHRVLCAIAVYFITSFVVQLSTVVIMTAFCLFDFYSTGTEAVADDILLMLIPNTVFSLILAVIQYAAAHYIMKKKINLI